MVDCKDPTFDAIIDMCDQRGLMKIMELKHDRNDELIAQFYATLWWSAEDGVQVFHWTLEANQLNISQYKLCSLYWLWRG